MGTERSDRIYDHYLSAADKFDYYIAAVSVALVGYLGPQIEPVQISLGAPGLELLAVLMFLGSAFAGFKRIEGNVTLLKMMHRRVYDEEVAGELANVAAGGRPAVNTSSGDVLTPATAAEKSQFHKMSAKKVAELLDQKADKGVFWARSRNWLLLGGLLVLIASRILPAYLS